MSSTRARSREAATTSGRGSKYTPPTIANGKVFVGTQADNQKSPARAELPRDIRFVVDGTVRRARKSGYAPRHARVETAATCQRRPTFLYSIGVR